MTYEAEKFKAEDAKALLQNPMLKDAFAAVGAFLEAKALGCDPDNKDVTQRIVLAKQILAGIKREIERHVENGKVAEIHLAELERKKRFPLFQR